MELVLPEKKHEKEYVELIQEFVDNKENMLSGVPSLEKGETYDDLLKRLQSEREGKHLKPGHVPSIKYFIIDDDSKIVGSIDIRTQINESLKYNGGNIGYSIRPSERRKGYATIGLKLALEKCKELGFDKVWLTCGKNNIGSIKTMIHNGGIRDSEYEYQGHTKERYRIPIK